MMSGTPSLKEKIVALVRQDLVRIESALEENLTPYLGRVRETAGHILFAGGKRLRPLLMVLSARLCGFDDPAAYRFSVMFEYLHAATLLHDDLVDRAELRRGRPAAHRRFGNETAVLTGDFLLARALSIAADTKRPAVIHVISGVTEQMSQGEIEQLENKGRLDLSTEDYLEVIRRKTAVLIEGACRVGALVAEAPAAWSAVLAAYGHCIGMAFQMADDLLDYTADAAILGKPVGVDLKEGKLTLPVIFTLAAADGHDRRWLCDTITGGDVGAATFSRFTKLLEQYGGIAHTRRRASGYIAEAKNALVSLPASADRDLLELIADYALARTT